MDVRQAASPAARPSILADIDWRAVFWQVLVVGLVVGGVWWLVANTLHNLEVRRIAAGFGFLEREAGFGIGEAPIPYAPTDTYARALFVGILNTLKVAAIGIVLATILGTLVGVARLSRNWLLARLAGAYVEVMRNVPLLVQLFFWYALLQGLPAPRRAEGWFGDTMFLTNRGVFLPAPVWQPAFAWALAAFAAGLVAALVWRARAKARQAATGERPALLRTTLGLLLIPPLAVLALAGTAVQVDVPALQGFNIRGGWAVTPEFTALLVGLTLYTAAFIGEIVRAGILAVSKGQWEAAEALGLDRGATLRLIVLPQALRVIIPPTTSQYLALTKNSSLAVAIGYPDLVSVANTTINQTGQAIEGVAIIMAAYLTVSLSISAVMNWYNRRIALVER